MHIPDNFLSPPVWATLDAVAIPAVGLMVRQAGRQLDDTRIPLLGVMGAFVFAAQMINFPVGIGTSGHLVGGALLAYTLGPAPAVLVMTVIIAIQAFVFQDGGVLALGANVFNMAVVGVLAGLLAVSRVGRELAPVGDVRGSFLVGNGKWIARARRVVDVGRRNAAADGAGFPGAVCGQRGHRRRHHDLRDPGHREAQCGICCSAPGLQPAHSGGPRRRGHRAGRGWVPGGFGGARRNSAAGNSVGADGQDRAARAAGGLHRRIVR